MTAGTATDAKPSTPPKRLAVIGFPVAHSRSPAMHTAALAELGLTREWSYEAIEVAPADLAGRVRALPGEGFVGANVTVPHKEAALALADSASAMAIEIGAANTLVLSGGTIMADNTDAPGFLDALGEDPAGSSVLVLGAGGAARAVVWALSRRGARVDVWNRTARRAAALAEEFGVSHASAAGGPLPTADYHLIVNATTVGMAEKSAAQSQNQLKALGVAADGFSDRQVVVDLAYGPEPTELVRAASQRGARTVDGIEVLVRQGAASLRVWTGLEPPLETMRLAARSEAPQHPLT